VDVWRVWLHEAAAGINQDLSLRAAHHATPLADVQPSRRATQPNNPDRVTIDPARITWPDPGKPIDLTNVATNVVDLGAGQGSLPAALMPAPTGTVPTIATPLAPVAPAAGPIGTTPTTIGQVSGAVSPATTNIVVNGNGTTINVNVGAAAAVIPTVPIPAPTPVTPPLPSVPDVVPATIPAPSPYSAPSSDWASALNSIGSGDFAIAAPAEVPAISTPAAVVPTPPPAVPITVDPPGVTTAAATVAAVAATGVATKVASGSAKPFLPFMPMGGGGTSGDEGVEPKRRVTRR
jgi:hypothetical protein